MAKLPTPTPAGQGLSGPAAPPSAARLTMPFSVTLSDENSVCQAEVPCVRPKPATLPWLCSAQDPSSLLWGAGSAPLLLLRP